MSRLNILEEQIILVLMKTGREEPAAIQFGSQPRSCSSGIHVNRQPDVKQQIIPCVWHPGPITRVVHGNQSSGVTTVPRVGMDDNIQLYSLQLRSKRQ